MFVVQSQRWGLCGLYDRCAGRSQEEVCMGIKSRIVQERICMMYDAVALRKVKEEISNG